MGPWDYGGGPVKELLVLNETIWDAWVAERFKHKDTKDTKKTKEPVSGCGPGCRFLCFSLRSLCDLFVSLWFSFLVMF